MRELKELASNKNQILLDESEGGIGTLALDD